MRDSLISSRYWTRGSGKRLRGNPMAQLVGLYLLSCESSNMIGLYYLPLPTLCHETGMTSQQARAALARCAEKKLAFYDEEAELVWVPNAAELRIGTELGEKDNRKRWIEKELVALGNHRFVRQFMSKYGEAYGLTQTPSEPPLGGAETPSEGGPYTATVTDPATDSVTDPRETVRRLRAVPSPAPVSSAAAAEVSEWAGRWKIPADDPEFGRFVDHHRSKGNSFKDWGAAWRNWKRNEGKYGPAPRASPLVQSAVGRCWEIPEAAR